MNTAQPRGIEGAHPGSSLLSTRCGCLDHAESDEHKVSENDGKLARRPELDKALLSGNRAGDQLVITKLDRLGRSLEHLIELSRLLQARGVDLVVIDQGIDTSTPVGRLFFQIIGAIAEFEHALMSERTMDGLAAARARGRTGGQKPKLGPRQVKLAREMYEETGKDGNVRTPSRRSPPSWASADRPSTATSPRAPAAETSPLSATPRSLRVSSCAPSGGPMNKTELIDTVGPICARNRRRTGRGSASSSWY